MALIPTSRFQIAAKFGFKSAYDVVSDKAPGGAGAPRFGSQQHFGTSVIGFVEAVGGVPPTDVGFECLRCAINVVAAATCADLPSAVEDDPDFIVFSEPESWWLGFTHE
jgi:hypothetical protein